MIYPWHQAVWQQLCDYHARDRLAHAILLSGEPAMGKQDFAQAFAAYLLCSSPQQQEPCGQCHNCRLLAAGNHPDFVQLSPQENSKTIKVDEIRAFVSALAMTPQIANRRVTVIAPAQAMNRAAANSLLKTLEEPNAENYILLVSDAPWELPATIRSRCQQMVLPSPIETEAVAWLNQQAAGVDWSGYLQAAQGSPLLALQLYNNQGLALYRREQQRFAALLLRRESPLHAAAVWAQDASGAVHEWIFRWLLDLVRAREAGPAAMQDQHLATQLTDLIPALNSAKLQHALHAFLRMQRGLRQRNLNLHMHYDAFAVSLSGVVAQEYNQ